MHVERGVGTLVDVQRSELTARVLTMQLSSGAGRGVVGGVCVVSMHTESNAGADVLRNVCVAAARSVGTYGWTRGAECRTAACVAALACATDAPAG
eukprot:3647317-Pleurochrysis_carterae.AAC.5